MINPKIYAAGSSLSTPYNSAAEYPHIVFDNFVNETILGDVSTESLAIINDESSEQRDWRMGIKDSHVDQVLKRSIDNLDRMPHYMNLLCRYFNSPEFMKFLRDLTGIYDLFPDHSLKGGGFHVTYPSGSLNIHHDFNYHDNMGPERVYRKVNLLVYLNEKWDASWKGDLELWKSDLSDKFKTIQPKYGRAILFNIQDAPHGHPHPLECPEDETRRSLAFYYYSKTPPTNTLYSRAYWKYGRELL